MAEKDRFGAGNIDLFNRPVVKNPDGSISTVRSVSVNIGGKEVLLPTVTPDGKIESVQDAVKRYKETGKYLGKFDTPEEADVYAQQLHRNQQQLYAPDVLPANIFDPVLNVIKDLFK